MNFHPDFHRHLRLVGEETQVHPPLVIVASQDPVSTDDFAAADIVLEVTEALDGELTIALLKNRGSNPVVFVEAAS